MDLRGPSTGFGSRPRLLADKAESFMVAFIWYPGRPFRDALYVGEEEILILLCSVAHLDGNICLCYLERCLQLYDDTSFLGKLLLSCPWAHSI